MDFPLRPTIEDLAYADISPLQKLDLYLPKRGPLPAPLVIWGHGGGFQVGDKRSMPRRDFGPPPKVTGPHGPYQIQVPDVAALVAKGYAVASLNYRLGQSMLTGAIPAIQDGKAAVRFIRAHASTYYLDPGRIAFWGNSAGGHMAGMLGVTGDQATVFDNDALGNAAISDEIQAAVIWFGAEDRLADPNLSIVRYIPAAQKIPPFLIVNGDADPVITAQAAERLHNALIQAGVKSTLTIVPGAGHEDPAFMATQMSPTIAFLDEAFDRRSS